MIGDLLKPKTFQFFAQYLLAGYVVIIARSRFVAGLRPKPAELIIEAVIFSLWVQMIVLCGAAIVGLIGVTAMLEARFGADWLDGDVSFLVQVLVVPAVFGAALGYNLSAGWKHALLRRLSLPVTHPVETGYDYKFGNQPEPCILLITYFDGTVIAGFFGEKSLAASNPDRRDIYLEYLYAVGEDGNIGEAPVKRSAVVSLDQVRSIEFLEATKEQ